MPPWANKKTALEKRQSAGPATPSPAKTSGVAAKKRQPTLDSRFERMVSACSGGNEPSLRARTRKTLTKPAIAIEISAVVSRKEK
jgi:hypothetical protein